MRRPCIVHFPLLGPVGDGPPNPLNIGPLSKRLRPSVVPLLLSDGCCVPASGILTLRSLKSLIHPLAHSMSASSPLGMSLRREYRISIPLMATTRVSTSGTVTSGRLTRLLRTDVRIDAPM